MNSKKQKTSSNAWCSRTYLRSALVIATLVAVLPAVARNANNQLCFPLVQWFGGASPNINTPVNADSGWSGALRYVFGNGTPTPDVVVQGIRDNNNLYISIEAHNMQSWDQSNVVTLAFDSGNGAANMQRVVIYPVQVGTTTERTSPGVVGPVEYSQDSSNWQNMNCDAPHHCVGSPGWLVPSNILVTYTCDKDSNNNCATNGFNWTLAVKLPITAALPNANETLTNAITVPNAGLFGFYVNVLRVVDTNGTGVQSYWPNDDPANQAMTGCDLSALCDPKSGTPAPTNWGNGTIDTNQSCKGVSIGSQTQDISTNHTVDGLPEIHLTQQNIFSAKVYNTTVNGTGTAIPAQKVYVTFRIANFGLPSNWGLVPTVNGQWNISSISRTGGVVTVNITTNDLGNTSPKVPFGPGDVGDIVRISGVTDGSFNNPCTVTWNAGSPPGPTQLTCSQAGSNSTSSGGVASYNSQTDGKNATGITDGNPTAPHDISANGQFTFTTDPWVLTAAQSTFYQTHHVWSNGLGEQCIQVQLDSVPGTNTVIVNNAAVQNMYFGSASKFKAEAEISAKGYPLPAGQTDQIFDLHVSSRTAKLGQACAKPTETGGQTTTPNLAGTAKEASREPVRCSQIVSVVHGCRRTGVFMTANGKKVTLCDGVGAFGFVVQHDGDTTGWTSELTGPGLQKTGPGSYQIHVPQDGTATVTANFEPEYPGEDRFAVFADIGAAIPNGTFGNAFNKGFSFNAGLEYIVNPHFSAEGIFGVHHFGGTLTGDLNVFQFTGGAKVYSSPFGGNNRAFFRAGLGGYHFTVGPSTNFGGYVGGGLLHELNAHWGIEGVYTFHTVNTPGTATKFSTVQGGIRYLF